MSGPIKRRYICHVLAFLFSAAIVAPVSWSLYDREPPFLLTDGKTVPDILARGKPYQFSWMRTPHRWRECTGTVYWTIVDSEGSLRPVPPEPSLFTTMKDRKAARIVGRERILSSGIPSGKIKFQSEILFVCNWTQTFWPIRVKFPAIHSVVE